MSSQASSLETSATSTHAQVVPLSSAPGRVARAEHINKAQQRLPDRPAAAFGSGPWQLHWVHPRGQAPCAARTYTRSSIEQRNIGQQPGPKRKCSWACPCGTQVCEALPLHRTRREDEWPRPCSGLASDQIQKIEERFKTTTCVLR